MSQTRRPEGSLRGLDGRRQRRAPGRHVRRVSRRGRLAGQHRREALDRHGVADDERGRGHRPGLRAADPDLVHGRDERRLAQGRRQRQHRDPPAHGDQHDVDAARDLGLGGRHRGQRCARSPRRSRSRSTLAGKPLVAFLGFAQTGIVDVTDTPALRDGTLQVYVKQWTGSAWDFVGSDLTGGGASNAVSFAVDPTSFVHYADTPSLAVDSTGAPVVAFIYNTLIDDAPAGNSRRLRGPLDGRGVGGAGRRRSRRRQPGRAGRPGRHQQQRRRLVQPVAGRRLHGHQWTARAGVGGRAAGRRRLRVGARVERRGRLGRAGRLGQRQRLHADRHRRTCSRRSRSTRAGRPRGRSSPGKAGPIRRRRLRSSCGAGTAPMRGRRWGSTPPAATASAPPRSRPSRRRWR